MPLLSILYRVTAKEWGVSEVPAPGGAEGLKLETSPL